MKILDKYTPKTLIFISIVVIYSIIMSSLEGYVLSSIVGPDYHDKYYLYHRSYSLFTWSILIQAFVCYIYKFANIKQLKRQLIYISLGLWIFWFGFTFL